MCFKVFIPKKAAYKNERKKEKKVNDCHFFSFTRVAMRVGAAGKKIFSCAKNEKFLINFKKPSFKKVCHMAWRANIKQKSCHELM